MKTPFYHELRNLRPHIRSNFIAGTQVYSDQETPVRYESEKTQELMSGILKHQGGVKQGRLHHVKNLIRLPESLLHQLVKDDDQQQLRSS